MKPGADKDCDHVAVNREMAKLYTRTVIERFESKDPEIFRSARQYSTGWWEPAVVPKSEKCKFLGKDGWDFTVGAYLEYRGLAKKYTTVKADNPRVVWPKDQVLARILALV